MLYRNKKWTSQWEESDLVSLYRWQQTQEVNIYSLTLHTIWILLVFGELD